MADLVTVGVTAFNAETSIERAIGSALAQDWEAIEIIVVDDCSTDSTASRAERIAARHPNIRVVRHAENGGVAVARNSVLQNASGAFVAFFDDDDESAPDRVRKQVERICDYERTVAAGVPVVCHTARRQVLPNGSMRIEPTIGTRIGKAAPAGRAVARRILMGTPLRDGFGSCATCSQMARFSTYRRVDGFAPAFRRSEDTELCVRLALTGAHFVGIAEPLVLQHLTVTSDKSLEDELHYILALIERYRSQFTGTTEVEFAVAWQRLKYAVLRDTASTSDFLRLGLRYPFAALKRALYALPMTASRSAIRRLYQTAR